MRLLKALSPLEAKSGVELIIEHSPDELISDEDQAVDELFHLMAGIAPVSAALGMTDLSDEDACHLLLQDTLAHRGKLLSWYSREMHRIGGAPSVGQSNEFPSSAIPSAEHLFGLPYRFPTLDNARIHIIYWAALSILQELIGQVYAYTYPFAPVDINNKNKEHQLAEYYADEISRGIPYCLQDRMKAWGASSTIFGMGQIAKVYMELGNSEKFKWSQELFKHEAELGSDLAHHMHHLLLFSWDTSQKARQRALSPESWGSMSHPSAAATPPSPVSSLSSASTAPFKEEYAALPGTIIVPVRPKLETDEVEC
ncbi:hypothetical protein VI817_009854 [Penicillium citrinum]|uniref:Uncharacterized protein n=1 Tax=Penicillium hetheringtonii TaxID=911720 RepID=A0AAD6GP40_9EURO|nr:hypothetical protein N7450_006768 [Penicillium hetheringtonii]KAK5788896.1 hypothetical protein VI817_009854 [Penicillium citrinum]